MLTTGCMLQTGIGEKYNHEAESSYSLTLRADDSNGGPATLGVTVDIINLNKPGIVSFSSAGPVEDSRLSVNLDDPDDNVVTTWQWTRSSPPTPASVTSTVLRRQATLRVPATLADSTGPPRN